MVKFVRSHPFLNRCISLLITLTFVFTLVTPPKMVFAQVIDLPAPGTLIMTTPSFTPTLIKGMTIHPENPFQFDFIVDTGDTHIQGNELKAESTKLIKYFLASLTIPDNKIWVNLSPYESDRIIPEEFGKTLLGKDMLSLDYLLKQVAFSLTNPQDALGKDFWEQVYAKVGKDGVAVDTFNKVWIVPQDALVYEQGNSAFVVRRHLKVMLEEDYVAFQKSMGQMEYGLSERDAAGVKEMSSTSSQIMKEMIIPVIEKEVNEGKTFASLRQIYDAMILAVWYKKNLKNSLLGQVYVDKNKTRGVNITDKDVAQKIYNQYLQAFKQGVYNYIKEDVDPATQEAFPRKYFSGGLGVVEDVATTHDAASLSGVLGESQYNIRAAFLSPDKAGISDEVLFAEAKESADKAMTGEEAFKSAVVLVW